MRKSVRLAAPAVVAAAALVLSGCGGSDDGGDAKKDGTQQPKDGGKDDAAAAEEEPAAEGEDLVGMWLTGSEDDDNVLMISDGTATFVLGDGEDMCPGEVNTGEDDILFSFTCTMGSTDWTSATAELSGDTLNVSWDSGTEEVYKRLPGSGDPGDFNLGDLDIEEPEGMEKDS